MAEIEGPQRVEAGQELSRSGAVESQAVVGQLQSLNPLQGSHSRAVDDVENVAGEVQLPQAGQAPEVVLLHARDGVESQGQPLEVPGFPEPRNTTERVAAQVEVQQRGRHVQLRHVMQQVVGKVEDF